MENTQDNKERFIALYQGQSVGRKKLYPYLNYVLNGVINSSIEWIELTPLSNITDEDAIEVAKILFSGSKSNGQNYHTVARGKDFAYRFNQDKSYTCSAGLSVVVKAIDFLRSKGYYLGDGTEIEYGWVKLKDNNHVQTN